MNTGAEAVETAIKMSRKWGYDVKGVPADRARSSCATATSTAAPPPSWLLRRPEARAGFGPFTPGFVAVPSGDIEALEAAITQHRRRAGRAGAGRGRRRHPAGRLPPRPPRAVPPPTCCSSPTRSSPASAAPARRWPATTRGSAPTSDLRQGAGGRDRPGLRDRGRLGRPRGAPPRPARQHLRRQPAGLRRRPGRGRDPAAPASYQARADRAGRPLRGSTTLLGHGVVGVRGLGLWAGVDLLPGGTGRRSAKR